MYGGGEEHYPYHLELAYEYYGGDDGVFPEC